MIPQLLIARPVTKTIPIQALVRWEKSLTEVARLKSEQGFTYVLSVSCYREESGVTASTRTGSRKTSLGKYLLI